MCVFECVRFCCDYLSTHIYSAHEAHKPSGRPNEAALGKLPQAHTRPGGGGSIKEMLVNNMPFSKTAAPSSSLLNIVTWNIAAVNNNPFEYWVTHHDPGYNRYAAFLAVISIYPLYMC